MNSVTCDVIVVLLTGLVWLTAAIWQGHNIRRQEELIARLWWILLSSRSAAEPAGRAREVLEATEEPDPPVEHLRPANRRTAG